MHSKAGFIPHPSNLGQTSMLDTKQWSYPQTVENECHSHCYTMSLAIACKHTKPSVRKTSNVNDLFPQEKNLIYILQVPT